MSKEKKPNELAVAVRTPPCELVSDTVAFRKPLPSDVTTRPSRVAIGGGVTIKSAVWLALRFVIVRLGGVNVKPVCDGVTV